MIQVCKMYSVYKVRQAGELVWAADGARAARDFGRTVQSFAVRVLGLPREGIALAATHWGEVLEVPLHAFGEKIPDTSFLPGAGVQLVGRGRYTVEASDEGSPESGELEVHEVRRGRGKPARLVRNANGWFFGAKLEPVRVVYYGREVAS